MKIGFRKKPDAAVRTSPAPLYHRVAGTLRRAIISGQYRPGERLPDERRLALQQGVSRATIRQALKILADARQIERMQGSGTYVSKSFSKATYVQIIAVGKTCRYNPYVTSVIGEAERSASKHDLRLSVRYLEDRGDLSDAIQSLADEQTVTGGMIVGHVTEADVRPAGASSTPWVMIGDFTDATRGLPPLDQVCGDDYAWSEQASAFLLAQGCRRPALLTYEPVGIWTRERVSAFRCACDNAGIPAADQHIRSLADEDIRGSDSVERFHEAVHAGTLETVEHWLRLRNPPDGILLPGSVLPDWVDILRQHPDAASLRQAHIVAMTFEQQRHMLRAPRGGFSVRWAVMNMSAITDQALRRLLETPRDRPHPVRDYIREVALIEASTPNEDTRNDPR